jgi:hypothetical protein
MNELIRPVKKALAEKYGYKNVSVENGRGTAWGWVEAKVSVKKPLECSCTDGDATGSFFGKGLDCQACKEKINKTSQEATSISYESVKNAGLEFYTYTSDDGYNTERSEFLLQVSLI